MTAASVCSASKLLAWANLQGRPECEGGLVLRLLMQTSTPNHLSNKIDMCARTCSCFNYLLIDENYYEDKYSINEHPNAYGPI
jgi:hypothetical protein